MEATRVSIMPETRAALNTPLSKKYRLAIHRQRALEFLRNRPYGQRTTGAQVARAAGYKFNQSGTTVLRSLEKRGLIQKHEIGLNQYFYTVDEPAKVVKEAVLPTPSRKSVEVSTASQIKQKAMEYAWENPDDGNDLRKFIAWLER